MVVVVGGGEFVALQSDICEKLWGRLDKNPDIVAQFPNPRKYWTSLLNRILVFSQNMPTYLADRGWYFQPPHKSYFLMHYLNLKAIFLKKLT